jgi:hypothetical protein
MSSSLDPVPPVRHADHAKLSADPATPHFLTRQQFHRIREPIAGQLPPKSFEPTNIRQSSEKIRIRIPRIMNYTQPSE